MGQTVCNKFVGIRSALLAVVACVGAVASMGGTAFAQPGQGTLKGTVSDADGPLAGAEVQLVGQNNNSTYAVSGPDGSYSVEAWPDTYAVGFVPPSGSSRGFSVTEGVTITAGDTTMVNGALLPSPLPGHVSGNASYADHGPDAGVEVSLTPRLFHEGSARGTRAETNEAGDWDIGEVPAGFYTLNYSVSANNTFQNLGFEQVLVQPGSQSHFSKELVGEKPPGTIVGSVIGPEGWGVERAGIAAGGASLGITDEEGNYRVKLPAGDFTLTATGGDDALPGSASTSVAAGTINHLDIHLGAKPVPPGTADGVRAQQLAWFDQQRARWGLPAGLVDVPLWSRACAAHNAYQDLNDKMDHPESPGQPGYSEGGDWAGTHSVLAGSGGWGPEDNPWNDAPIHLNQMMAAQLSVVGIDVSHGYSCLTTWPGMKRKLPAGQVYTYPGDGTSGIPPAEFAAEAPFTTNKTLGVPDLAGRHLFVYEGGLNPTFGGTLQIESASLASPSGPVAIKYIDGSSLGYLAGGDILPVRPLEPFTTYTATVRLGAVEGFIGPGVPAVTHTWSFTTGANNPNGHWSEGTESGSRKRTTRRRARHHRPTLKLRRRGNHMVALGAFFRPRQKVVLRRQPGRKLIARVRPNRQGRFQVSLKWGHLPTLTVVAKQGKVTVKARMKASGGAHRSGRR